MSIYGVSSGLSNVGNAGIQRPLRDGTRAPAQQPANTPAVRPQAPAAPSQNAKAATPTSIPAEPPAGTDPALWSVLSGEERAFFAKAGAMGPLTYGRAFEGMRATQLPASRGGRLDVKV